ncbi:hypothetical protein BKA57DRAFT_11654 [Linnemannia elongata]|nr:hypothetical protein BKA57DRAFT_11654 [Linnemannia elongata]
MIMMCLEHSHNSLSSSFFFSFFLFFSFLPPLSLSFPSPSSFFSLYQFSFSPSLPLLSALVPLFPLSSPLPSSATLSPLHQPLH